MTKLTQYVSLFTDIKFYTCIKYICNIDHLVLAMHIHIHIHTCQKIINYHFKSGTCQDSAGIHLVS